MSNQTNEGGINQIINQYADRKPIQNINLKDGQLLLFKKIGYNFNIGLNLRTLFMPIYLMITIPEFNSRIQMMINKKLPNKFFYFAVCIQLSVLACIFLLTCINLAFL